MCEAQSTRQFEYTDTSLIDEELICIICEEPFLDPTTMKNCKHTFCRSGIEKTIQKGGECPICRDDLTFDKLDIPAFIIINMLNKILVKCKYCGQDRIERGNFNDHIMKVCPKYPVSCCNTIPTSKCEWVGVRCQLLNHRSECNVEVFKYALSQCEDILKEIGQLEYSVNEFLLQHQRLKIANESWAILKEVETRAEIIQVENECLNSNLFNLDKQLVRLESEIRTDLKLQPQYLTYVPVTANWSNRGKIVAGSHQKGCGQHQLSNPYSVFVDYDQTVYIADFENHRIMSCKVGETNGTVVAGGNGPGYQDNQLNGPTDLIITPDRSSLIICDCQNRRVVQWPLVNGSCGKTIIKDIDAHGLTIDEDGFLYVADYKRHEIKQFRLGESQGTVVAGGNGAGHQLDQFNQPIYVFVDQDRSLYVTDEKNDRVIKWIKGAKNGTIVASGVQSVDLDNLSSPSKVVVDQLGSIYVADWKNNRIVRWLKNSKQGQVIIGGNSSMNQLNRPNGLFLDLNGSLYVSSQHGHQILKFEMN